MGTKPITDADFEKEVLQAQDVVLVDFWAEWCGPCRALGPKLEEISNELGDKMTVAKMNIDENPSTPAQFGVRSIPTMVVFKGGQAVEQIVGNLPKEAILETVNKYI